jgi:hypothetical protein
MKCTKRTHLRGGFYYTIRTAKDDYTCFFCGRVIPRKAPYVEERSLGNIVRRYHYECFNRIIPHKLKAVESPSGVVLCEV